MRHNQGEDNSSTSFENIELLTTPRSACVVWGLRLTTPRRPAADSNASRDKHEAAVYCHH